MFVHVCIFLCIFIVRNYTIFFYVQLKCFFFTFSILGLALTFLPCTKNLAIPSSTLPLVENILLNLIDRENIPVKKKKKSLTRNGTYEFFIYSKFIISFSDQKL